MEHVHWAIGLHDDHPIRLHCFASRVGTQCLEQQLTGTPFCLHACYFHRCLPICSHRGGEDNNICIEPQILLDSDHLHSPYVPCSMMFPRAV